LELGSHIWKEGKGRSEGREDDVGRKGRKGKKLNLGYAGSKKELISLKRAEF